jgi:pimeloyl-ACP methyl ester carboxylesterase
MIARLLLALMLCASSPSFANEPNRFALTHTAAERFEIGATLVERHGAGPVSVILIPGLASGPWAWQDALADLKKDHTVYVLTLPGFDGRPAVEGMGIGAAQESLRELIAARKLDRPVLIGHSLGGTLSIGFAAQYPDLVRGVVSLDGLPLFPGTEDWDLKRRGSVAAAIAQRKTAGLAQFAAEQQQYMRGIGVSDMARADELAKLTANSDPAAVMRYVGEVMTLDLRPVLPKITAPVLVLSPYLQLDADQQRMTEPAKTAYYTALMDGTPNVKVVSVPQARHVAMFDQPQQVNAAIRDFLKTLK